MGEITDGIDELERYVTVTSLGSVGMEQFSVLGVMALVLISDTLHNSIWEILKAVNQRLHIERMRKGWLICDY